MAVRSDLPSPAELLDAQLEHFSHELHTCFPGRLQNYDSTTQTADIVPLMRHPVPQADGTYPQETLPVLPRVRVMFPRSDGFFISFPLRDGDTVLVVCCESDITGFTVGDGSVSNVRMLGRHNLSNAVAIPGLVPHRKALRHVSATDLVMGSDDDNGLRVFVSPNGAFNILRGNDPVMHIDPGAPSSPPSYVALAPLVDAIVSSLKTAIANWTPVPNDGGASLKAVIAAWSPASVTATKLKAT